MTTHTAERVLHRGTGTLLSGYDPGGADPVTTEVVRHGLNSAAEQMKRTLVRTAFSPIIYEAMDFAAAIYDRDVRLLAQAAALPIFMGTMSYCVHGAVDAVGGEEALKPGDVILYNDPYGSGSHQNDMAVVMPVFHEDRLVGYTAIKGHYLDVGGKDPYITDSVDVFQEGTIFPGVKIVDGGEWVGDIFRLALANSRLPKMMAGDLNAEIAGLKAGARELTRIIERHGHGPFMSAVERMFDHGETVVRGYIESIPDGRYTGRGVLDSNGVDDDLIPFEVDVVIDGGDITVDFGRVPEQQGGPINTPMPQAVSACRIALSMLAGGTDIPNEGHFRPLTVVTVPGTMMHPVSPAPVFLGWAAHEAMEVIFDAIATVVPEAVPAWSGGNLPQLAWGPRSHHGRPWADGCAMPVGQGASAHGDGAHALQLHAAARMRVTGAEILETRNPWLVERAELRVDSCGPGRHRGGLGVVWSYRALEDFFYTAGVERTKTAPPGFAGGRPARSTELRLEYADGSRTGFDKVTRLPCPRGSVLTVSTGGGGGYGPPSERAPEDVRADLRLGYITEEFAREHYPHVDLAGEDA
ncbi:hydantoinase B/oxoprolinase family protein [Streptomyces specialis]|uniref:hydantoinase B/oxoprolinase family protein n=1 Tax=Streptomyces specialis TaxID=498367 RepID=UPI00099E2980|nr:hydantoinase B/oxoprolinase family protein [Streptomyces specialis]